MVSCTITPPFLSRDLSVNMVMSSPTCPLRQLRNVHPDFITPQRRAQDRLKPRELEGVLNPVGQGVGKSEEESLEKYPVTGKWLLQVAGLSPTGVF